MLSDALTIVVPVWGVSVFSHDELRWHLRSLASGCVLHLGADPADGRRSTASFSMGSFLWAIPRVFLTQGNA